MYTYTFQMKYGCQEFQAHVEVYLFVHERTFLSRDLSTPE